MASFVKSIDVNVPLDDAYRQFSDFESFPSFMEGVESVQRLGGDQLNWHANIAGRDEEWTARITEQAHNASIAWESISGTKNLGRVSFEALDSDSTRVHMYIEYEPEGLVENIGTALGVVNARIAADLERFKELVEGRRPGQAADDAADAPADKVIATDLMDGGQRREQQLEHDRVDSQRF